MSSILLTIMILLPLIGALFIYQNDSKNKLDCSLMNCFFMFCVMIISIYLFLMVDIYSIYDSKHFFEHIYISEYISYSVAVNGLNGIFILATCIIFFCLSLISVKSTGKHQAILSLVSLSGILGVFLSQNIVFLMIFLIISFFPVIYISGKDNLTKIQIIASLFILLAVSVFIQITSKPILFGEDANLLPFVSGININSITQIYLFLPVMLSIFILSASTDWMMKTCAKGSIYGGIVAVTSKVVLYIAFMLLIPIFPEGIKFYHIAVYILLISFMIYKCVDSFRTTQLMRQIVNYSSVHSSLILLLISGPMSSDLLKGIVISCLAAPFVLVVVLGVAGIIKDRELPSEPISGLAMILPRLRIVFSFGFLAMLSLPGTLNFPAQFVMLYASVNLKNIFAAAILLLMPIFTAIYLLNTSVKLFYGKLPMSYYGIKDVGNIETAGFTIIIILLVVLGIYPYYVDEFIVNFAKMVIR